MRNGFCGEEVVHCNGALARTAVDDGATQLKAYTHTGNGDEGQSHRERQPEKSDAPVMSEGATPEVSTVRILVTPMPCAGEG